MRVVVPAAVLAVGILSPSSTVPASAADGRLRTWDIPGSLVWAQMRHGATGTAGASFGFAEAAVSGNPPAPSHFRHDTNPQRTQGYWDDCPH